MKQHVSSWHPQAFDGTWYHAPHKEITERLRLSYGQIAAQIEAYINWSLENRPVANHNRAFSNWLARLPVKQNESQSKMAAKASEGAEYKPAAKPARWSKPEPKWLQDYMEKEDDRKS